MEENRLYHVILDGEFVTKTKDGEIARKTRNIVFDTLEILKKEYVWESKKSDTGWTDIFSGEKIERTTITYDIKTIK